MWQNFVKLYQEDLFKLWSSWVPILPPQEDNSTIRKVYYIDNPEYDWNYRTLEEDNYDCDGILEFIELVDKGDRVMSFETFMCCAYENSN